MSSLWQWLEEFWGKIQIPSLALNILDVLIIAVLFYLLFLLIKRTRAFQLFQGLTVGLIVMLLASVVAGWIGLTTLEWVLRTIVAMLVGTLPLVLAIIFQPELRHFLARIGRGGFIGHNPSQEAVVDQVVTAVRHMSADRIGALIVLEKASGLVEVAESGVQLDSLVSTDTLESIFFPNSPLHDGAVLIRGNRIEAARVMIPLPDSVPGGEGLGTRHNAGLSLSRDSDAQVIIVSEQTGMVSLAREGKLQRDIKLDQLRGELLRSFNSPVFGSVSRRKEEP
ncbi:MAG: diadenylate cyclase CdaA [Coprothermobacterota bacterium]|nr:diadenylate cyclase CdaA [Coprothermobacterota bacterium]